VTIEAPEKAFVAAVRGMLARPDYLIPLAAAERQFRDHYYGLNSAALLEDLFYDALGNYVRQTSPQIKLERPPPGQKGWDYLFDGLKLSHKVSQKADVIAAIWDATKQGIATWSFDEPIVYVLGGNTPNGVDVTLPDGEIVKANSVAALDSSYPTNGRTVLVVSWPADGRQPLLVDIVPTDPGDAVPEVLAFSRVWDHVAAHVAAGGSANEIDVLVTRKRLDPLQVALLEDQLNEPCDLAAGFRAGVYLLARDTLQDLTVTSNNRGILIPKATVSGLLAAARRADNFVPMPLWYWMFAQKRPPDMYFAQRAEYDSRFSARGDLDRR